MEPSTMLYLLAAGLVGYGYMKYSDNKKDVGKFSMFAGVVVAGAVFFGAAGIFLPLAAVPSVDVPTLVPGVEDGTCQVKVYSQVNFSGDTWGANDPTAPAGSVDIYTAGVNPSDTGTNRLDTISITSGVGGTTSAVLESCTNYGIVYNGASAEYDMWYKGIDWTQPNSLPYVSTTDAVISNAILKFDDVVVFATIPDPIEENAVTGIINGQTNVSGNVSDGLGLELRVGADATPADSDVIYYNKTNGDLSYYIDITLGAEGANKQIHEPVLCFVNDHTNPFDGDEFTAVTLQRQSGTDFGLPTDITDYVNNADCVPMGAVIEGGQTGVYRMQFTAVNANLAATTDVMYIYPDDMGDYLGKDILRNTKATAGAVIEMQFQV